MPTLHLLNDEVIKMFLFNNYILIFTLCLQLFSNIGYAAEIKYHGKQDINKDLIRFIHLKDVQMVKELIRKGADVNTKELGMPALIYAVRGNSIEIIYLLLENGADINKSNRGGETALMYAVLTDKFFIVGELILRGANLNAKDGNGMTALMKAAYYGRVDCATALLNYGADISLKDNRGRTAIDLAKINNQYGIISLFSKYDDFIKEYGPLKR